MEISLPLNEMNIEEKLRVMEMLWNDLTRDENAFPSPAWHEDVLKLREARLHSDQEALSDWETAKKTLRDRLQ